MTERRAIGIEGIVQGVGFRPFVSLLASQLQLAGFVRNTSGSVEIEIEGDSSGLNRFLDELSRRPPPLARIERLSWQPQPARGDCSFHIIPSQATTAPDRDSIFISPDVATCEECLADIFDPGNRRYLYPFTNCTHCGPRLTIVHRAPYDRCNTTMASFGLCDACRQEYENPANRRYHAQPICCPVCGPRLRLIGREGDPINVFADAMRNRQIGAIKGLGGYHLACDAGNESAVRELRRRKHREEKPLAIMVADLAAAKAICHVDPTEAALLAGPKRPIVLLKRRTDHEAICDAVAPGNPWLGIMLAYTPLHHILMRNLGGLPLVMTSGNRSDEPICSDNEQAVAQLSGIADLFLAHDRPISIRCDDSVTRVVDQVEQPIRRSRGYAPQPIRLPMSCAMPILAVGGQLKATFALGRRDQAFVSHHLGDLDQFDAYQAFEGDVQLYEKFFDIHPQYIVHDLHPDYASTAYARRRAGEQGLTMLAVQHHHAHVASCMADNGLDEPVIGVAFDGTGYGTDGTIWGGEFLVGDYRQFRRAAHLRNVGMPGGEQAIRQPWRMAASHLADSGCESPAWVQRQSASWLQATSKMLTSGFNTHVTSSAGRLFDAVASLIGVRDACSYEGQAAVELESLAASASEDGVYPWSFEEPVIDTRPLIRAVVDDVNRGVAAAAIARRFHEVMADLIAGVCKRLADETGLDAVVLSGGVFLNALLAGLAKQQLTKQGLRVFTHRHVPPNDGGLSLGQLAVAASRIGDNLCA
jgi:hydrogenase maturation protein HypF